ncbi:MAG: bifunctional glutamate N-acetyltransferase/amino-acid acetyltransferase ArgJ, partial [Pseudomonadota bacterium]
MEGPAVSPLAPAAFPALPAIAGVEMATANSGTKYRGRDDVLLARMTPSTAVAGTLTRSLTRSAPVHRCEALLAAHAGGTAGAEGFGLVVNAGNANAFTGRNGEEAVARVTEAAGKALGLPGEAVFIASTGVIGEPLDHGQIAATLGAMADRLGPGPGEASARAIMTTDTFPKAAASEVMLDGVRVRIAGIAKGSGMIAPDMATMLVFIFTDAAVDQAALQDMVSRLTDRTFNSITVDSDTSTSDTLLVAATGAAEMAPIAPADSRLPGFEAALCAVMHDLAIQVVKDGEGATKLVRIVVDGAATDASARKIGLAIANSPLVKTAIAGEDPNWGRIVMAVGKAGEPAERDRLTIRLGDMVLAEAGWRAPSYDEAAAAAYMKREEIEIGVDLAIGSGRAVVHT